MRFACEQYERVRTLNMQHRGPDHPDTQMSMWRVGDSLVMLDRGAEAVALIDEWLKRGLGKVINSDVIGGVVSLRLRHFAKVKDAARCRETAEMWERLKRSDAVSLYNAACYRAVTAPIVKEDAKIPEADAQRLAQGEADAAMAWLRQAVAAGYKDVEHMKKDTDLDALRGRDDFKTLLAELEVK